MAQIYPYKYIRPGYFVYFFVLTVPNFTTQDITESMRVSELVENVYHIREE